MNEAQLFAWMMVFLRGVGLLILMPGPGGRALPVIWRLSVAVALTTLVYPFVPIGGFDFSGDWTLLMVSAIGEVITGLALGFVGRFLFQAVETAGRVISSEIGIAGAPGFEAPDPAREPLAAFISSFGGLLFFVFEGHFGVIAAFARTFSLAPAGDGWLGPAAPMVLARESAFLIELAVRIAAPFIALNFLMNLSFSILTRVVPRMNVFVLSFPVRTLGGFLLLAGSGTLFVRYFGFAVNRLPMRLLELVAGG